MTKTIPKAVGLTAAIGLSALILTGCGSKSKDKADAQPSTSTPGASSSSSAGAGSPSKSSGKSTGTGKGHTSGKGATVLPMTASVRSALRDTYMANQPKRKQADLVGPTETHYGKVGGVYYAIGEIGFKNDPTSRQDGPHVWKSPNGMDWSYEGDTGGEVCDKVPTALVKAWGKSCG